MHARKGERPLEDHEVDRPEVYGEKSLKLTGTNGRVLDHINEGLSVVACRPPDRKVAFSTTQRATCTHANLFFVFQAVMGAQPIRHRVIRSSPLKDLPPAAAETPLRALLVRILADQHLIPFRTQK